jgi:hypothetical protein
MTRPSKPLPVEAFSLLSLKLEFRLVSGAKPKRLTVLEIGRNRLKLKAANKTDN